MTVGELMESLKKFSPDVEIMVWNDDFSRPEPICAIEPSYVKDVVLIYQTEL